MILLIHIVSALASLVFTAAVVFLPSAKKLRVSYALVVLTITTGSVLMVMSPHTLAAACKTGLLYLAIVTAEIFFAKKRLAAAQ